MTLRRHECDTHGRHDAQVISDDMKRSRRTRRTERRHTRFVRQDACFSVTGRVGCSSVGVQYVGNCRLDVLTHKPQVVFLNAHAELIHLMVQIFWRQQRIETAIAKSYAVWEKRYDGVFRLKLRFLLWVASDDPNH